VALLAAGDVLSLPLAADLTRAEGRSLVLVFLA
jgi:hypothetical protein